MFELEIIALGTTFAAIGGWIWATIYYILNKQNEKDLEVCKQERKNRNPPLFQKEGITWTTRSEENDIIFRPRENMED